MGWLIVVAALVGGLFQRFPAIFSYVLPAAWKDNLNKELAAGLG